MYWLMITDPDLDLDLQPTVALGSFSEKAFHKKIYIFCVFTLGSDTLKHNVLVTNVDCTLARTSGLQYLLYI